MASAHTFAWLLKGRSCSSERARLHRWPSGWQTWLAIFKRTQSAYKPIDLLDLLYLAQKFASARQREKPLIFQKCVLQLILTLPKKVAYIPV